jgi:hypothetical protein
MGGSTIDIISRRAFRKNSNSSVDFTMHQEKHATTHTKRWCIERVGGGRVFDFYLKL